MPADVPSDPERRPYTSGLMGLHVRGSGWLFAIGILWRAKHRDLFAGQKWCSIRSLEVWSDPPRSVSANGWIPMVAPVTANDPSVAPFASVVWLLIVSRGG